MSKEQQIEVVSEQKGEVVTGKPQRWAGNPLANITITTEEEAGAMTRVITEAGIGLIPIPGVKAIYDSVTQYRDKVETIKLHVLLNDFGKKHDSHEEFERGMVKFLTTSGGSVLFQKIIRVVNSQAYDFEYIEILSRVLKRLSVGDMEALFDKYNYVLSQIEKLTPQALLLLSDHMEWPSRFSFPSSTTSGHTVGDGWDKEFAMNYVVRKHLPKIDLAFNARIAHAARELLNNGIVSLGANTLNISDIGKEILSYI